jgi:diadenosine tetraphosphatase ApaH/serine/threonine PP2A family protein phosphatase
VRYLILSDLHANLEALEAVVADAAGLYDEVLCLGDVVGYGADPNAVTGWTMAHARMTVRGNHDRACTGQVDLAWFNPVAQAAVVWTDRVLAPEHFEWLKALPQGPLTVDGFQMVHGAPQDEDQYLLNNEDAWFAQECCTGRVIFFGHTHVQGGFEFRGRRVLKVEKPGRLDRERVVEFGAADRFLINVGSVGQPRDRDPRAAYALYDPAEPRVVLRRVEYDVAKAQRKIREASLPVVLADRLADGR